MKFYLMCDNGIVGHVNQNGGKGTIASAYALFNSNGELLAEGQEIEKDVTNNYGELKSIREGLIYCLKNNYKTIIIMNDNQYAVNCLTNVYSSNFNIGIIEEIKQLLKLFDNYEIKWIPRELNLFADHLTAIALEPYRTSYFKRSGRDYCLEQQKKMILEANK